VKLFLAALCLALSSASADSATQTDWSGGPGTPGPVTEWDAAYYIASLTEDSLPGQLGLESGLLPNLITLGLNKPETLPPCWGDIDLDGDIDMLWVSPGLDSLAWFENPGDPTQPWSRQDVAALPGIRSIAMMDRTDSPEPVFAVNYAEAGNSKVSCFRILPSGWTEYELGYLGAANYMTAITAADLDDNGITDVIGVMWAYDEVRVWWNHDEYGMETILTPHCPIGAMAFDGDADGDKELAIFREYYPVTQIFWNSASGWEDQGWLVDIYYSDDLDAGDVDDDGLVELAAANGTAWLCDYIGYWFTEQMSGGGSSCAIADVDLDSDNDILFLNGSNLNFFLNTGSGTEWNQISLSLSGSFAHLDRLDFDSEGDDEILISAFSTGTTLLLDHLDPGYPSSGWLLSSILYTGNDPDWGDLSWTAATPPGTTVSFQVRASDDPSYMGTWSDTLWAPTSLHGLLADNSSYFQYRAILNTANPDATPSLQDVTITWDPLGTGEGGIPLSFELLPVTPNPCTGSPSVVYGLPAASFVEVSVFDVYGRLVRSQGPTEYQPGWHSAQLEALSPGVYFIRMRAGEFEATQRFVMLN